MKRITFLGLGIMGGAMARRLLDSGFDLTVWNRNASRADALVKAGARIVATPADGARNARPSSRCSPMTTHPALSGWASRER